MAQDLTVTLVIDDRQYTAKLKQVIKDTEQMGKTATDAGGAIDKKYAQIGQSFDNFDKKVRGLRTQLLAVGAAFGVASAIAFADDLQDLSNATNIATNELLNFGAALQASGGQSRQMANILNVFIRNIDEAAEGGLRAQLSFQDLGVSIDDLRMLGERDLLLKTLKSISQVESASRRAALMQEYFGRSMKSVNPADLIDGLEKLNNKNQQYNDAIQKAAQLSDVLAEKQKNLQTALLLAFEGPLTKLLNFNDGLGETQQKIDATVAAIKVLGITLAAVFGIGIARSIVGLVGQLGRAGTVIAASLGGTRLVSGLGGLFRGAGPLMVALRGIGTAIGAIGAALTASALLFEDFGDRAVYVLKRVFEALLPILGGVAGGALGAALGTAVGGPVGGFIGGVAGAAAGVMGGETLAEPMRRSREEIENAATLARNQAAFRKSENESMAKLAAMNNEARTVQEKISEAQAKASLELETQTNQMARALQNKTAQIKFETQILDLSRLQNKLSEDDVEIEKAINQLFDEHVNKLAELSDRQDNLRLQARYATAEQKLGLDAQIAANEILIKRTREFYQGTSLALREDLTQQQNIRKLVEDRQRTEQNITKAIEDQISRQRDLQSILSDNENKRREIQNQPTPFEQMGMSTLERQVREIVRTSEQAAAEARRTFAEGFSLEDGMNPDQIEEFNLGLEKITKSFSALSEAQVQLALDTYVTQTSFQYGWTEAFQRFREDAENNAKYAEQLFSTFTRGFEDAIVNFAQTGKLSFKDMANSIIADIIRMQVRRSISGFGAMASGGFFGGLFGGDAGSNLALSFAGPFANGGNIPQGKFALVGEKGPELFMPNSGGTVISNDQLTKSLGGGGTAITYNISAVDATSFKQLVARDPQFIYNVTEAGRRSTPSRRLT